VKYAPVDKGGRAVAAAERFFLKSQIADRESPRGRLARKFDRNVTVPREPAADDCDGCVGGWGADGQCDKKRKGGEA
jgi:hypothetical protein